jgi:hypothetical protein
MNDVNLNGGHITNTDFHSSPSSSDNKQQTDLQHNGQTDLEAFSRLPTTAERLSTESPNQNNQETNPAQAIAHEALKDGRLTLSEANQIYNANTDPNFELTVDASQISVIPKGKIPLNGNVNARVVGGGDWLVHGNVSLTSTNGKLTIKPELYDFDYKSGIEKLSRNIETFIGEVVAGEGMPFKINFDGSPTVFIPETGENDYP